MTPTSHSRQYIKLILVIAIWASLYHVAKIATKETGPVTIAFIRYVITAAIFIFIHKFKTGNFIPKLDKSQWLCILALGLVGICLYNLLFFSAESLISGNLVAIMYAFAPCITTVISSYIFKARLNFLSKVGILIALLGSIGVINYATPECGKFFCSNIFMHIGRGEVLGMLATITFACYSVISKYTSQKNVPSITMNTYAAIIGTITLGLFAFLDGDLTTIHELSLSFWFSVLYMSIIATVIAYLWYTDAIIQLGVFRTVVFQNTIPLQAVIIGYVFFGARIGMNELLCGVIVLIGVYITNYALALKNKV